MQAGGAVYARVPDGSVERLEAAIKAVRAGARGPLGVLKLVPGEHAFACVDRWGKSDDVPPFAERHDTVEAAKELAALSREVGEVVAFYEVEDGAEYGVYVHWRDGQVARHLGRTDGEWSHVVGEPQPWEAGLFAPERLEEVLQYAEDDGLGPDAVRAAFAAGRLAKGAALPRPHRIAELVARSLRAPLYGFQPWPRRRDEVKRLLG